MFVGATVFLRAFVGYPAGEELAEAAAKGLVFIFYPVAVTLVSFALMAVLFRSTADMRRLFGIYSYTMTPFLIAWIPVPLFFVICLFLSCYLTYNAFYNAFGHTTVGCALFGAILPIGYWLALGAMNLDLGRYLLHLPEM